MLPAPSLAASRLLLSPQEEEERPAHPKEEEDASMQHVESGWTLVSGRRRREWVDTHPAHRVPVGGKTTAHRAWVDTLVRWAWVTEVVREDVQGLQSIHGSVLLAPPRAPVVAPDQELRRL